jgi:RNA polymerase sigma factor (sigma-70 family)
VSGRTNGAPTHPSGDAQARVATIVNTHGPALLRVAQRVSLCTDDAQDAVQRALEIYWRRVETLDPSTEAAWLRVVVRNEALAVRKLRVESVTHEDIDLDGQVSDSRSVEDRVESAERVQRSAEALRHLKQDEATALLLKAEGHSYEEISERLDWSRTKVNRAITEGRARFFKAFHGIESGEQCEQFAPMLAELAGGEASSEQLLALRPHLRHCRACRATVRHLHTSRLKRVAALLPVPAFLRPAHLKTELYSLFGRTDPSLAAFGSSSGRGFGTAALIGLCIGGAGAGGYCVATGKLPDPVALVQPDTRAERPAAERAAVPAVAPPSTRPESTPTPRAAKRGSRPARAKSAVRRPRRKRPQNSEFAFETRSAPPSPTPAPAVSPNQPTSSAEFDFEQ